MRLRKPTNAVLAALAGSAALAMLAFAPAPAERGDPPPLGLMGTIPIYWGEAGGLDELIAGEAEPHWARETLSASYELRPLDYLDEQALAGLDYLLLAQPRALSGEENVALDAWVRAGGRLLLFADPMMTNHSRFSIGDRRRPMDVTLLSPILGHWGLAMDFAEDQPFGVRSLDAGGLDVPVNLPGHFELAGTSVSCTLKGESVLARCKVGKGTATILADAAVLDLHEPASYAEAALQGLLDLAFGKTGESAGP